MILSWRIEIFLCAHYWWLDARVLLAQLPECTIPLGLVYLAAEQRPTIFVHCESEWQENNFIQRSQEQLINARLLVEHKVVQQIYLLQMLGRRYRQWENITNSFMETRIGASSINKWQMLILQEVLNVSQLMVHGKQLALSHLSALLDAHVVLQVEVPGAGMTDQITAICGFLYDRFVPEIPARRSFN